MNLLADMSWLHIKGCLERDDRVILPLGATEEHGRHLGLGTDFIEAEAIALRVGEMTGVVVAPTLNYGMSLPLMGFPGTISLRPSTLLAVLEDILSSLHNHGFRRILIINGHGGNIASISSAVHTVSRSLANLRVKHFEWWMDTEAYKAALEKMDRQAGSHASLGETSFMMAVRPSAVYMQELTGRDAPDLPSREFTTVQTFAVKYPDGIMGLDPRHADRSTGEALLHKSAEICARELEEWS